MKVKVKVTDNGLETEDGVKVPLPIVRGGIKEAVEMFWTHIGRVSPSMISSHPSAKSVVNEALLLALAKLNKFRDERGA